MVYVFDVKNCGSREFLLLSTVVYLNKLSTIVRRQRRSKTTRARNFNIQINLTIITLLLGTRISGFSIAKNSEMFRNLDPTISVPRDENPILLGLLASLLRSVTLLVELEEEVDEADAVDNDTECEKLLGVVCAVREPECRNRHEYAAEKL